MDALTMILIILFIISLVMHWTRSHTNSRITSATPTPAVSTLHDCVYDPQRVKQLCSQLRDVQLKMVLLVRTDCGMSKGKMIAQSCHAAVGAVEEILHCAHSIDQRNDAHAMQRYCYWSSWNHYGAMKIALRIDSEEQLLASERQAREMHLPHCLIADAGHTQVAAGTRTALAIGPAPESLINQITGSLKLL